MHWCVSLKICLPWVNQMFVLFKIFQCQRFMYLKFDSVMSLMPDQLTIWAPDLAQRVVFYCANDENLSLLITTLGPVRSVPILIVSITKFSISVCLYLSRNRCAISGVSNYRLLTNSCRHSHTLLKGGQTFTFTSSLFKCKRKCGFHKFSFFRRVTI